MLEARLADKERGMTTGSTTNQSKLNTVGYHNYQFTKIVKFCLYNSGKKVKKLCSIIRLTLFLVFFCSF